MISVKLVILLYLVSIYSAPPVRQNKSNQNLPFDNIHYNEYLSQVLKELEGDKAFSKAVSESVDKNRTEHLANSLAFVNRNIRSRLDELKRVEIERLNQLESLLERKKRGENIDDTDPKLRQILEFDKEHIDHKNPHSFEVTDLEKLIHKTEKMLSNVDKAQEEQYKEHEMKKDYLKQQKLKVAKTDAERQKLKKEMEESEKRHKDHAKLNRPGSKEQLQEVWENDDHMKGNKFDSKAFFEMHDLNSDGHLDINELEALMKNELDKVYDANSTDDDMQEKYHENMKMRQELLKVMDKNGDDMVSKEEFLAYGGNGSPHENAEWKTTEELADKPYNPEEYEKFVNDYEKEEDGDDMFEDDEFSDQDEFLRNIPHHAAEGAKKVDQENIHIPKTKAEEPKKL